METYDDKAPPILSFTIKDRNGVSMSYAKVIPLVQLIIPPFLSSGEYVLHGVESGEKSQCI